jgi:hypothetical protein
MSATQKVQQHPAFVQAQTKANYYLQQLDKDVRTWFIVHISLTDISPSTAYEVPSFD